MTLLCALVLSCLQGAPPPAEVVRPRDPWVFRSVLDERPRIVTIALSDEMWVAYDATTCGLYRAWKGGVVFDGAVYTTRHGPQPTSRGTTYVEGYDETKWEVTYKRGPDTVRESVRAVWRGYRLEGTRKVTLLYELQLKDGRKVRVEESPEYVRPMDRFTEEQIEGLGVPSTIPGLLRLFHVIDPPAEMKFSVRLRTDGARFKQSLGLERESFEDLEGEDGEVTTRIHSHLILGTGRKLNYLLMFYEPRPSALDAGAGDEGDGEGTGR